MDEETIRLAMIVFRKNLQQLAMPADRQIAKFPGCEAAFEVADDFGNSCLWALSRKEVPLTDEQRSRLQALDARLDAMSGPHNAELWTDDALRSRPEWEEVRSEAREILKLLQWPLEGEPRE